MEYLSILLFCAALLICLLLDVSIVYAMLAGLLIFVLYGLRAGYSLRSVSRFAVSGIKTAKDVLLTFIFIGMLTALWRQAGTIPVIVCFAARAIRPAVFLLMAFLLNCLISVLTGTSFGTAATMGVICSTMGMSLGVSPLLMGGAILSGIYFGDRCSPVSTSALLTAAVTETDIFANIKRMLRSSLVPFLLTGGIYAVLGLLTSAGGSVPDLSAVFAREFVLSPYAILPAAVLLLLSLCKVRVRLSMAASILSALPVCLLVQHTALRDLPRLLFWGFAAGQEDVARMLNGGGIVSMLKVAVIVYISSAYAGIFQNTGLLTKLKTHISRLADHTTPFFAILLTSVVSGLIACNQTLTIMLTQQLAGDTEPDRSALALALEDSAVVVAPLVPWSIACAVPLDAVGAPSGAVLLACFLYLLPLWHLLRSLWKKHRTAHAAR